MGTVYLAVDEAPGTQVALKVVRRDRAAAAATGSTRFATKSASRSA